MKHLPVSASQKCSTATDLWRKHSPVNPMSIAWHLPGIVLLYSGYDKVFEITKAQEAPLWWSQLYFILSHQLQNAVGVLHSQDSTGATDYCWIAGKYQKLVVHFYMRDEKHTWREMHTWVSKSFLFCWNYLQSLAKVFTKSIHVINIFQNICSKLIMNLLSLFFFCQHHFLRVKQARQERKILCGLPVNQDVPDFKLGIVTFVHPQTTQKIIPICQNNFRWDHCQTKRVAQLI